MSDWIAGRAVARSLHRSSHSIVADLDSQPVQNAAARQSPRGVADQPYDLANPCRPASMGSGNFRYRFSKDLAGTSWVAASKAPRFQAQFYRTPLPRQVFQPAKVRAVTAPRHFAALWTTGGLLNVNIDKESVVRMLVLIQHQMLGRQYRLRMARGRGHCKLSFKQSSNKLFWTILDWQICTESAEDPENVLLVPDRNVLLTGSGWQ